MRPTSLIPFLFLCFIALSGCKTEAPDAATVEEPATEPAPSVEPAVVEAAPSPDQPSAGTLEPSVTASTPAQPAASEVAQEASPSGE